MPFLRNRPHDVKQHVMSRYGDKKQFLAEKVLQNIDGVFEVESASRAAMKYMVTFDVDGMPRCDCFDWNHFYLPCKHFCAIFHLHPDYGWDSLHASYRDSPFFTLNESIVGTHSDVQQSAVDSISEQKQDDNSTTGACEDRDAAEESHWLWKAEAASCREILCTTQMLCMCCDCHYKGPTKN